MEEKESLVVLVLVSVVLLIIVLFMVQINTVTQASTDTECAVSVVTRAASIAATGNIQTPLRCYTTHRDIPQTMTNRQVENAILLDLAQCYTDFAAAYDRPLVRQQDGLCMVCNTYSIEGVREIDDVYTKFTARAPGVEAREESNGTLELQGDYAILFFQQRNDAHPILNQIYQAAHGEQTGVAVGAISGAATVARLVPKTRLLSMAAAALGGSAGAAGGITLGRFVSDHETASTIFLTPYTQQVLDEAECTVFQRD